MIHWNDKWLSTFPHTLSQNIWRNLSVKKIISWISWSKFLSHLQIIWCFFFFNEDGWLKFVCYIYYLELNKNTASKIRFLWVQIEKYSKHQHLCSCTVQLLTEPHTFLSKLVKNQEFWLLVLPLPLIVRCVTSEFGLLTSLQYVWELF